MSKTVSARIPTTLHRELCNRCNNIGESINDFVEASIKLALDYTVEFDFGTDSEESSEHPME